MRKLSKNRDAAAQWSDGVLGNTGTHREFQIPSDKALA